MVVKPASVRACVRSHFQRYSSLKPIKAKFYVEHPWVGGTKACVFIPPAKRSFRGVYCFQPVRDSVIPSFRQHFDIFAE